MVRKTIASIGLLALANCSTVEYGPTRTVSASELSTPAGAGDTYGLGPGDKLLITVYGEENLSGEQLVGPDGTIAVPLVGRIPATGRTASAVSEDIRIRLADGFVQKPSVTVTINAYRPFYILGEVNTPGQYEYAKGMTVLAAVARGGGFTYRAKKSEIFLRRDGQQSELRVLLDTDMPIHPGDTIRVGERFF